MLANFFLFGNLPTFSAIVVVKIFEKERNVQHRHNSTRTLPKIQRENGEDRGKEKRETNK